MSEYINIKNKLTVYLVYLQVITSLTKRGVTNKEIREGLVEASDFLNNANREELLIKGPVLIKFLQAGVDESKKLCPPRIPIEQIAQEFNEIYLKNKDIYHQGLECGWLQKAMDCSKLLHVPDFPYHTRIGLGEHAGFASIEEDFLLKDAFFLLALAEEAHERMHAHFKEWKKTDKTKDSESVHRVFGSANQDVAAYSRLCILSFFSFVEAFVNSTGHDFLLRNNDKLDSKESEILSGHKNGRYLSLEYKIEKFPSIISKDKKIAFVLSDPKQIKEPFKTFIETIKQIRESSVHYSPIKVPIWRKPEEWIEIARKTSKNCTEIALLFWKSCYPSRTGPVYLHNLDYDKYMEGTKTRIRIKNELLLSS